MFNLIISDSVAASFVASNINIPAEQMLIERFDRLCKSENPRDFGSFDVCVKAGQKVLPIITEGNADGFLNAVTLVSAKKRMVQVVERMESLV